MVISRSGSRKGVIGHEGKSARREEKELVGPPERPGVERRSTAVVLGSRSPPRVAEFSQSVSHYHTPTNGAHGPHYTLGLT